MRLQERHTDENWVTILIAMVGLCRAAFIQQLTIPSADFLVKTSAFLPLFATIVKIQKAKMVI